MKSLSWPAVSKWPWLNIIAAIALILTVIFLIWWYAASTLYDKLSVWLTLVIPVDPIITTLISDLFVTTFLFALLPGFILRFFFKFSKSTLMGVYMLVLVSIAITNLTLGRDVFFDKNGNPRQFFVIRADEGLIVTGAQSPDPTTGEMPKPIYREIVPSIRAMYRGHAPTALKLTDIDETRFFDPGTGRALIWYYEAPRGKYRLYNGPGFDTESQEPLRPVTQTIVDPIKKYISSVKVTEAERNHIAALQAEKRKRQHQELADHEVVNRARASIEKGDLLSAKNELEVLIQRRPDYAEAQAVYDDYSLSKACNGCGSYRYVTTSKIKSYDARAATLGATRPYILSTVYDLHFAMDDSTDLIVSMKDNPNLLQGKRYRIISTNGQQRVEPLDNTKKSYANVSSSVQSNAENYIETEAQGFIFQTRECTVRYDNMAFKGGALVCDVLIENSNDVARELIVGNVANGESNFIDNQGNKSQAYTQRPGYTISNKQQDRYIPGIKQKVVFVAYRNVLTGSSVTLTIEINGINQTVVLKDIPVKS